MSFIESENSKDIFPALQKILLAFDTFWPDIGYVQGMSHIIFFIYFVHENELDSFTCFSNLILSNEITHAFFTMNIEEIERYSKILTQILRKIDNVFLDQVLTHGDVLIQILLTECVMTFFTSFFPFDDVLWIFETYFYLKDSFIIFLIAKIFTAFSWEWSSFETFEDLRNFTHFKGYSYIIQVKPPANINHSFINQMLNDS